MRDHLITGAAICPPAPLLARELTGRDPVVPELRKACSAAVDRLIRSRPDVIAVVGAARSTQTWPPDGRLNLTALAPAPGARDEKGDRRLPLPLGLGTRLLDEGGYRGERTVRSVNEKEQAAACLRFGADLSRAGERVGLLIMADGSARRGLRAPGYLDPRAAPFDAEIERAVRDGQPGALRDMDEGLAGELLATARPAWQVLAGAMPDGARAAEVLYADDPFGVFYLVAWLAAAL